MFRVSILVYISSSSKVNTSFSHLFGKGAILICCVLHLGYHIPRLFIIPFARTILFIERRKKKKEEEEQKLPNGRNAPRSGFRMKVRRSSLLEKSFEAIFSSSFSFFFAFRSSKQSALEAPKDANRDEILFILCAFQT